MVCVGVDFHNGGGGLVAKLCPTPRTVACQAPVSMGFPRQEYWSRLPFASPRDLHDPWIEPMSPVLADGFFTTEPPEKPSGKFTKLFKEMGTTALI